jgi:uncharacterized membrane protein YgcG
MENACWQVNLNLTELPINRVSSFYAIAQSREILTIRTPRDGEEWMALNLRHGEQRWSVLNLMIAVLSASRVVTDRTMLEQFEALVQPTQFLEFLRKTMPISETHLDMVTSMHETMMRRLNAFEVLYKGRQRAVDKFTSSSLTGMDKLKASAVAKAKKSNDPGGTPNRKKQNGGGGGAGGGGSGPQVSGSWSGGGYGGQNPNAPRSGNGFKCEKCNRLGHKTGGLLQ